MKTDEMRKKSVNDLEKFILKSREKMSEMMRNKFVVQRQNVHELRYLKKDIARAMTIINEKRSEQN